MVISIPIPSRTNAPAQEKDEESQWHMKVIKYHKYPGDTTSTRPVITFIGIKVISPFLFRSHPPQMSCFFTTPVQLSYYDDDGTMNCTISLANWPTWPHKGRKVALVKPAFGLPVESRCYYEEREGRSVSFGRWKPKKRPELATQTKK